MHENCASFCIIEESTFCWPFQDALGAVSGAKKREHKQQQKGQADEKDTHDPNDRPMDSGGSRNSRTGCGSLRIRARHSIHVSRPVDGQGQSGQCAL
jgi:hypothetical protein